MAAFNGFPNGRYLNNLGDSKYMNGEKTEYIARHIKGKTYKLFKTVDDANQLELTYTCPKFYTD